LHPVEAGLFKRQRKRCKSQGKDMRKFLLGTIVFMFPAISLGQDSGRAQGWDFSIAGIYQQPDIASGQGGSSLDVDDTWGFGFNIGYHFSNRLSVNADSQLIARTDFTR
jgi:hypothetical protein